MPPRRSVRPAVPVGGSRATPGRNVVGSGLSGDVGGIRSLGHLLSLLDGRYLQSSYAIPPNATKNRGTRTVAITPNNVQPDYVTLSGGTAMYTFKTPFRVTPFVTAIPIGSPVSGSPSLFISNLSPTSVQISSTDNTDSRTIHVVAFDAEAFGGGQDGFTPNVLTP